MKNIKKLFIFVMCMLMAFTSSICVNEVKASTHDVDQKFDTEWTYVGDTYGTGDILSIDGVNSFCLEPLKAVQTGVNSSISASDIGLTQEQIDTLVLISWYGYRSRPTTVNYFLTQNLIWDYLGTPENYAKSSVNGYPDKQSMKSWNTEVMKKVNDFHKKTSFHNGKYSVYENESLTLTDTNKVLSDLNVKSITGGTYKKDGNTLKLTPNPNADKITVVFNRGLSAPQTKINLIVRSGNSQAVSTLTGEDPYSSYVTVDVIKNGRLQLAKKDEFGNLVGEVSFKVSYNADMSDPIGTYTTGNDGTVILPNELKPGKVYIQEVKVPDHLVLDDKIYEKEILEDKLVYYTAVNMHKRGNLQLAKKDEFGNLVGGVSFKVSYNKDMSNPIGTYTTKADGIIILPEKLLVGKVYIQEVKVPEYLILDNTIHEKTIQADKLVYFTAKNKWKLGSISITKKDEANSTAQGDGTLEGAEYVLKANEIIKNGNGSVLYEKDEIISNKKIDNVSYGDTGTKKTDSLGKIKWNNLPKGKYYISEVKASDGYTVNSKIYYAEINKDTINYTCDVEEKVISGKIRILKTGNGNNTSTVLEGVEFEIKLASEVEKVGWEAAKSYAVITTDENGYAESSDLPYGKYVVRETKTPAQYIKSDDFEIIIDKDGETIEHTINNRPFSSWLKIIKTDEFGNVITLSNAEFKIKDSNGEYVTYDNVDQWSTDETGICLLPFMLDKGEYSIEEVKAPVGFYLSEDEISVIISTENEDIEYSDNNEPVLTVAFKNQKQTGKIILNKLFEEDNGNCSAIFELMAEEDIINTTDGSVIYSKSEIINEFETNEEGKIIIENLPLGKYSLTEKSTEPGYILNNQPILFELAIDNETEKEITVEQEFINFKSETLFVKTDVAGKELEGAKLILKHADTGIIIDSWISANTAHIVKGLVLGERYILTEEIAPKGYKIASDIEFTFTNNKQEIQMIDEHILTDICVNKVDSVSKESVVSKDFVFGLYTDKECKNLIIKVHADKSTGTATFKDLPYGTYYIKELKAPKGYKISDEVKEIIIDENLEGIGSVHSFVYENTLLPGKTTVTNDSSSTLLSVITLFISISALVILKKKKYN